jgi:hypothetical protein
MDLIFVWLDGSQTVLAYSTVGLTIAVYAADFTGLFLVFTVSANKSAQRLVSFANDVVYVSIPG